LVIEIFELWSILEIRGKLKQYPKSKKRLFDLILTILGCVILLPLFIVIALFVKRKLGSPILFRQQRPGLHGKPFILFKYRTMTNSKDENGNLLPAAQRLTKTGSFLRSTSLDELPELWNVLKGEMSLVGPRPLRMEYLSHYTKEQNRRHDILPGITGWAQVMGRNAISWENKFKLDLWYVNEASVYVDLKILILTFYKVLKKENINKNEQLTMEPFKGAKLNG
jgi:sugar transferase EpsL